MFFFFSESFLWWDKRPSCTSWLRGFKQNHAQFAARIPHLCSSMVKMLLKREVGGHVLNSHGNYIFDHGKIMELCFLISVVILYVDVHFEIFILFLLAGSRW